VALIAWETGLFEYLLQVPANRNGYTTMSLAQLKMLQEVITLVVFVQAAMLYMPHAVKITYLYAGALPARRGICHVQVLMPGVVAGQNIWISRITFVP